MRIFWLFGGLLSLGLGLLGIPLPLLPTVPFLLLAAFCFARSSERLHDWLVDHPTLGPPIIAWRDNGAISSRGKKAATIGMAAAFCLSVVLGVAISILMLQAMVLCCVGVFIWSRPEG